tara:strand:+ start:1072 stop:2781 length:1710 start_codon:yes stop_codon:yes gene_type:complete
MADVKDWGIAATSNSVASPDGAQQGWLGADVGPWGRETMAAVARWNKDPSWTNFTQQGIEPAGTNKAVTVAGSPVNRINLTLASGTWASGTGAKYFPPGRLIRFDRGNANPFVYCFVVGTSTTSSVLSVDVAPIGIATVPAAGYVQNGVEFYSAMESADTQRNLTPLSAMAFGGHGTTAERNAKFAGTQLDRYPQGMSWFNTEDDMFQVLDGGAWLNLAPLRNNWSFGGSILEVGSDAVPPGNPNGVQVQMKFPQGDTAAISMWEFAADQSLINRGNLGTATSAGMGAVYLRAPTDGSTSAAADKSTYCQTILYGENSIAANAGHMMFQKFDWDDPTSAYVNTLGLQDMTPGFVDAGFLGGQTLSQILARSTVALSSNYSSVVTVDLAPVFDPAVDSLLTFSGGSTGTVISWDAGTTTLVWRKTLAAAVPVANETVTSSVVSQEPATLGAVTLVNSASGAIRLGEGAVSLLIQWPEASDWTFTTGSQFEKTYTYTFPTAYATAPAVIGSYLYTSNEGAGPVYSPTGYQPYTVSTSGLSYLTDKRAGSGSSTSFGRRIQTGVPLVIGVEA